LAGAIVSCAFETFNPVNKVSRISRVFNDLPVRNLVIDAM